MNDSEPSPQRHPGAPIGNTNALKHGFYSRRLKKRDLQGLDSIPQNSLAEEVSILRVLIRTLLERSADQSDFDSALALLRTVCLASDSISRLLRTQIILSQQQENELIAIIQRAVIETADSMMSPELKEALDGGSPRYDPLSPFTFDDYTK